MVADSLMLLGRRIAESAFTQLGSCVLFDRLFQLTSSIFDYCRGYRLYGVSQVLWCSAGVDPNMSANMVEAAACDFSDTLLH